MREIKKSIPMGKLIVIGKLNILKMTLNGYVMKVIGVKYLK